MSAQLDGWCPTCRETVVVNRDGRCLWCETPTTPAAAPQGRRRHGGKPKWKHRRLSEAQVRVLYQRHLQGASINALAKRVYARLGYKTPQTCCRGICDAFKDLGLRARDRIEATQRASRKHGLAPKHGPRPGYGAYKRRVVRGQADRPRCKGIRQQYPRKGQPCSSRAMVGSDYCYQHDPEVAAKRDEHLARMRERVGRAAA